LPHLGKRLQKVHSVEQVEKLGSKLNVFPLRDVSVLRDGEVRN
jgi:hypothetical protein